MVAFRDYISQYTRLQNTYSKKESVIILKMKLLKEKFGHFSRLLKNRDLFFL